ncbi:MAG: CCA tRNA nucleotidyltransferase, partial [Nitrospirae bacterium]|nr:CCA tRNA nucleotidyltransferase [Nitrospirota bacterium]
MKPLKLDFISTLRNLRHIGDAYIVGGTVRDILIGKDPDDIDIAVPGRSEIYARTLSEKIEGTLFILDKKRGIFRLLTKSKSPPFKQFKPLERLKPLYYDISPIRGDDIYTDLSHRDFTIDAMAIPLSDTSQLIDPYNGKADIERKCIRAVSGNSFAADPLRLLRAFRLASTLGFEIDSDTIKGIREMSSSLRLSAKERIRDEFFRLLSSPQSIHYLNRMDNAGLLKEVLTGMDDIKIRDGLIVLERLEHYYSIISDLFFPHDKEIREYLSAEIEGGITNAAFWKWLTFYVSCDAPAEVIINSLTSLRLGKRAGKIALSANENKEAAIIKDGIANKISAYHFFKSAGDDGIGVIL